MFASNGGADTVIGTLRPQDVFGRATFGTSDGIEALTDTTRWLSDLASGSRTMADEIDNLQPLEPVAATQLPSLTDETFADAYHGLHDRRIAPAEADYLLG